MLKAPRALDTLSLFMPTMSILRGIMPISSLTSLAFPYLDAQYLAPAATLEDVAQLLPRLPALQHIINFCFRGGDIRCDRGEQ